MSLLEQLRDEIQGLEGDAKAEFLRGLGVDVPEPAEPPKPPTVLDKIREIGIGALQELELVAAEIPGAHEVAPVLGVVVKVLQELGDRVDKIEQSSSAAAESRTSAAGESGPPAPPAAPPVGGTADAEPPADAPVGSAPGAQPESAPTVTEPAPNYVSPAPADAAPHTDQVRGAQE